MDRRDIVKTVLIVALLVAIAAAAFGVIHYMDTRSTSSDDEERDTGAPDPIMLYLGDYEYEVTDYIKTYLISGTDGVGTKPNAKHYHGPMADYMLLLIINKTKNVEINTKCALTERQKDIILAGGLLNYTMMK